MRVNEISEAAKKKCNEKFGEHHSIQLRGAFLLGAEWADANPEIRYDVCASCGLQIQRHASSFETMQVHTKICKQHPAFKLAKILEEIEEEIRQLSQINLTDHGLGQLAVWNSVRRLLLENR